MQKKINSLSAPRQRKVPQSFVTRPDLPAFFWIGKVDSHRVQRTAGHYAVDFLLGPTLRPEPQRFQYVVEVGDLVRADRRISVIGRDDDVGLLINAACLHRLNDFSEITVEPFEQLECPGRANAARMRFAIEIRKAAEKFAVDKKVRKA